MPTRFAWTGWVDWPTSGAPELARLTNAAERTARRWILSDRAPRLVVRYLQLLNDGSLGLIAPRWEGWRLRGSELYSPEGQAFRPGEIRAIPLRVQQIAALERAAAAQLPASRDAERLSALLDAASELAHAVLRIVASDTAATGTSAQRPALGDRAANAHEAPLRAALDLAPNARAFSSPSSSHASPPSA